MTNKEFLAEVQKACHLEISQCQLLMSCLQKVLGKAGVDQLPVVLSGLGVFASHKHPEYIQEDPQTGAMTLYPPRISYHMQSEGVEGAIEAPVLLAEYAKVAIDEAQAFVSSLIAVTREHVEQGEEIGMPGIGVFALVKTHNSEVDHVGFTPDEKLRDLVNAPFNCFEEMVISGPVKGEKPVVEEESLIVEEETPSEEIEENQEIEEKVEIAPSIENKEINNNIENKEKMFEKKPIDPEEDITEYPTKDDSNTKLIYFSLSLIMLACLALGWVMFGSDIENMWNNPPVEAEVVDEPAVEEAEVVEEGDSVKLVTPEGETVDEESVEEKVEEVPVAEEKAAEPVKTETAKPEPVKTEPVKTEPAKVEPVTTSNEMHRMMGADGKPVTVTLKAGDRLTLVALEHFGDKAFWPYVFEVNKDRLKAPNLIQAGMKLYLPDPKFYGIDANSTESLNKAKNLGAKLLK